MPNPEKFLSNYFVFWLGTRSEAYDKYVSDE